MRRLVVVLFCFGLSGCAYYLTPRPPIMERKLGRPGHESVGALATAADYRMIYVRISDSGRVCAEPPPDAAGQFAAQLAAAASGPLHKEAMSADAQASFALSMKQIFRRSQGVQFYRDGLFALCNLYLNNAINQADYLSEMKALRTSAAYLIEKEIPELSKLSYDPVLAPVQQNLKKPDNNSSDEGREEGAEKKPNDESTKDGSSGKPPDEKDKSAKPGTAP